MRMPVDSVDPYTFAWTLMTQKFNVAPDIPFVGTMTTPRAIADSDIKVPVTSTVTLFHVTPDKSDPKWTPYTSELLLVILGIGCNEILTSVHCVCVKNYEKKIPYKRSMPE